MEGSSAKRPDVSGKADISALMHDDTLAAPASAKTKMTPIVDAAQTLSASPEPSRAKPVRSGNDAQKQRFAELAAKVAEDRDKQAFAELFHHFAPRVNAYLIRLNLDNGSAEEMTQEIMVTLWNKAHMFDPSKSSLPTWLFRIARNRRIDAVRRQKTAQLDPHDPMLLPSEPEHADVSIDAVTREARVREALQGLPDDQVKLIRLAFFTGLSHSQIATETGLPLGTVKSRIRLAFNRLRGVLEALPDIDAAD